jgi:protein O-mannosyl-transferase
MALAAAPGTGGGRAFFVGSLFPAVGFVNVYPFIFSFVADHFQYLASLGIFALAGAGLAHFLSRRPAMQSSAVVLGLLAVLGVLTWRQSGIYRNEFTLYEATLAKNPLASMAHNNLSNALVDAGRWAEAIPHLEAVIKLRPDSPKAENNLGQVLIAMRNPAAPKLPPPFAGGSSNTKCWFVVSE